MYIYNAYIYIMYIYTVYIYNAYIYNVYIYTYISIPMYRSVLMNMCMQGYNTSMNMNVSSRGCAAAVHPTETNNNEI